MGLICMGACGNNPIASPGAITFYTGKIDAGAKSPFINNADKAIGSLVVSRATIIVNKIEISKNGTEWIEVLNTPTSVDVTNSNEPLRLGNSLNVPSGQYESLRMHIQSKIDFLFTDGVSKTLNVLPTITSIGANTLSGPVSTPNGIITFSTAGGSLNAFQIERGTETNFVFDITIQPLGSDRFAALTSSNCVGWNLYMLSRATRIVG